MHYRNGREAKIGDKVVGRDSNGNAQGGILIAVNPGETCNGVMAFFPAPCTLVTLSDMLHVDDAIPKSK